MSTKDTFDILSPAEKEEWAKKMGKSFISELNLVRKEEQVVDFNLNFGTIGDLRVVDCEVEPCEMFTDFQHSQREKTLDILQELYVASGLIEVQFKDFSYELKDGDILIIDNNNLPISFKIIKSSHIISVYMPLMLIKSWIPRIWDNLETKLITPPSKSALLLGKYLEIIKDFALDQANPDTAHYQPKAITPLIMSNLSMLVFALADLEDEKPLKIKDIQLDSAKQFMLLNISNPLLSPHIVSEELGISVRYLHWIFKHSNNSETVSQYLIRKRLELAQLLLASSSSSVYSVTEVAFMCGFNDSTHFSRRFNLFLF